MTADEYDTLVGDGTGTRFAGATPSCGETDLDGLCGTIGGRVGHRRGRPAGIADERARAIGAAEP